jgi:uncharacterized protein (DUF2345 family)
VNTPVTTTLGGNLLVRGGQGITLQFSNPASALQTPANLNIASDRTINATGVLSSGGSTTVSAGDNLFLTSSQVTSTGGNIALSAAGNLGLNQDQLTAPLGNVLLSAQRQVSIQDGATPFLASAGGNLFIQGNQGITIQAVNPTSLLASTGDLSLFSPAGAIASNIPIQAGGAFSIQANGDLTFGNYTGPSLNLFSGGYLLK